PSPRQPLVPGHEFKPEPVIVDHEISVAVAPDRGRLSFLYLLRHDPHIGGMVVALVAEAIELDAIVEPCQRDDVFLEADVGMMSTAVMPATTVMMPAALSMSAAAVCMPAT